MKTSFDWAQIDSFVLLRDGQSSEIFLRINDEFHAPSCFRYLFSIDEKIIENKDKKHLGPI